jgi:hypothetical protein
VGIHVVPSPNLVDAAQLPPLTEGKTWIGDAEGKPAEGAAGASGPLWSMLCTNIGTVSSDGHDGWHQKSFADLPATSVPNQTSLGSANSVWYFWFNTNAERGLVIPKIIVPAGATQIKFELYCGTSPALGAPASNVLNFYTREYADPSSYPSAFVKSRLAKISHAAADADFHKVVVGPVALASMGLAAGKDYQVQVTRDPFDAEDDLAQNFNWNSLYIEVT